MVVARAALTRIAEMAQEAIETGGRIDLNPAQVLEIAQKGLAEQPHAHENRIDQPVHDRQAPPRPSCPRCHRWLDADGRCPDDCPQEPTP